MPASHHKPPPFFAGKLTRSQLLTRGSTLVGLFIVGVAIVTLGGLVRQGDAVESGDEDAPPLPVRVQEAQRETQYVRKRSFVGRIEPARVSDLGFELGGLLIEVKPDEGTKVEAGEVIAKLDTTRLQATRRQKVAQMAQANATLAEMIKGPREEVIAAARARVAQMSASLRKSNVTADRAKRLNQSRSNSDQDYDVARFDLQAAEAMLRAAEAELDELLAGTRVEQIDAQEALVQQLSAEIEQIDVDLQKSTLVAPFSGTIAERYVDEGNVLETGAPVVQLLETDHLEAHLGVDPAVLPLLNQEDAFELKVGDQSIVGALNSVRPDRHARTRTVKIRFDILRADPKLHVGDLVRLQVNEVVEATGYWLPIEAMTEGLRGLWTCYVAVRSENESDSSIQRVGRRDVEVIELDTDRVFVVGTLQPKEEVIIEGAHRLTPGMRIRVVPTIEEGNE